MVEHPPITAGTKGHANSFTKGLVADDLTSTLSRIFTVIREVPKAHGIQDQPSTPHVS